MTALIQHSSYLLQEQESHANSCVTLYMIDNCSNYVFSQVHIIQMTSLIHHSIYLLQEQECVTHLNTRSLHFHGHLLCQFIIGLLQRCAYTPSAPPRFMDSASTWPITFGLHTHMHTHITHMHTYTHHTHAHTLHIHVHAHMHTHYTYAHTYMLYA